MGHETPPQPPEGRLIEHKAKASGLSVKKLAANAGISDTRWRHIVRGWQPGPDGTMNPVTGPASTVARMALAAGVSSEDLAETGRTDAADLMPRLSTGVAMAMVAEGSGTAYQAQVKTGRPGSQEQDEIELVYASQTMSAKQKLETIRMILQLRVQAEWEAAAEARAAQVKDAGEESATSSAGS